MKSLSWIALFCLLVFGIGWTSRLLAERPSESADRSGRPERGWFHSRGRYGRGGPFISTIEQFGDELALTDLQRTRLDEVMLQTVGEIEEHEHAIRDLMRDSRPKVLEILSTAQRETLDERIREQRRQHADERRKRQMDWLQVNTSLDDRTLPKLEAVLIQYSDAKASLFEGFSDRSAWPGDDELHKAIKTLRSERDAGLSSYLDAETLREFQSNTDRRYHARR